MIYHIPQTWENFKSLFLDYTNKLIDRTVTPLHVNYENQQVGVGTVEPQTYAVSGVGKLIVSGNVYVTGTISASAGSYQDLKVGGYVTASGLTLAATATGAGGAPNTLYMNTMIKAFCRWNITPTIVNSFNINGITGVGSGKYIFGFATAFINSNYLSIGMVADSEYLTLLDQGTTRMTAQVRNHDGTTINASGAIIFIGDQ